MRRTPVAALLLLAACGGSGNPTVDLEGGEALEKAARSAGLVADPARVTPVGVFVANADRLCVVPARQGDDTAYRVGVSVDYGEGQRCAARGSAVRRDALAVDLGRGCRFDAQNEGDRIIFPRILPAACEAMCEGRATLAALRVDRLSDAAAEAARLRDADGALLCAD